MAHLGVLSVLVEAKIPIDLIVGTSFGAIVGALYAADPDIRRVQEKLLHFLQSPAFKKARLRFMRRDLREESSLKPLLKLKNTLQWGLFYGISITRPSFISEQDFTEMIEQLIEDREVDQTQIPLLINAADLTTGKEFVWDKGPLRKAICATCALPGIFPPVRDGEHVLMDGGWINPVPVSLARRWGADLVIASDTSGPIFPEDHFNTGLDLLTRADAVARSELSRQVLREADVVIQPDVGHVHWTDFSGPQDRISEGQAAAKGQVEKMKRLLFRKRIRKALLGSSR